MSTYFTKPSDQTHHNGKTVGVISNGDSQTAINEKLAAAIEELKATATTKSNTSSASTTTDDVINTTGFGVSNEYEPTAYTVTVKTTTAADGINYFYNLLDINIPGKINFARIIVEDKKQAQIINTVKTSTSFLLSPLNFPAYISFDIRVEDSAGIVDYYSAKAQLSQTNDTIIILDRKKFGGTEIKTQTEVNNYLYNKVGELQKTQTSKVTYADQGELTLQETVNRLVAEVQTLKSSLDISEARITYSSDGTGNIQKTVSEALSEITAKLNTL